MRPIWWAIFSILTPSSPPVWMHGFCSRSSPKAQTQLPCDCEASSIELVGRSRFSGMDWAPTLFSTTYLNLKPTKYPSQNFGVDPLLQRSYEIRSAPRSSDRSVALLPSFNGYSVSAAVNCSAHILISDWNHARGLLPTQRTGHPSRARICFSTDMLHCAITPSPSQPLSEAVSLCATVITSTSLAAGVTPSQRKARR